MKRRLLLVLPCLQQLQNYEFRLIKYSRFPPLSLLTIAGLIQGHAWYHGEVVYRVLPEMYLYNMTRVLSGALVVTGSVVGLYNVIRSLQGRVKEVVP